MSIIIPALWLGRAARSSDRFVIVFGMSHVCVCVCVCVSVFGLEEGDRWNLDCKQTDILSSHNKWSGVSTDNYGQRQLGTGQSV